MGMLLGRDQGVGMSIPYATWTDLLELAQRYGWRPTRTGAPRRVRWKKIQWSGTYYSSDGQLFYARDARAVADALDRFLAAEPPARKQPPKSSDPGRKRLRGLVAGLSKKLGVPLNQPGQPTRTQSWADTESGKEFIREFVAFCRGGSFRLY